MKKTLVSILLLIWLLQCSLPTLVYLMGLEQIKREHQSGQFEAPLECLIFKPGEKISWLEKDKEFDLQGKRFDVVSVKDSSGFVVILAHADTKEDRLLADFHQSNSKNSKDKGWLKQWNKLKLYAFPEEEPGQFIRFNAKIFSVFVCRMPDQVYAGVLDPPPDFL